MNRLHGVIRAVQTSDTVALADVEVGGDMLSALIVADDTHAIQFKAGTPVQVLFQETEVSLAKNLSGLISLRNRLRARIKRVDCGAVLTRVTLDYRDQDIVAIITTRSTERLALAPGDEIEALVKANEVTLVPQAAGALESPQ